MHPVRLGTQPAGTFTRTGQPLIVAYLIAGFFIGPFGMGWVKSRESIGIIAELGVGAAHQMAVPVCPSATFCPAY